jgi:hypothetical protein
MVHLLFLTTLNCSQFYGLISRLEKVVVLTPQQKVEILNEVRKVVPSCPVTIQVNKK